MRFAPGVLLVAAVALLVIAGQPAAQVGDAKAQPGGAKGGVQPGGAKGGKKATAPKTDAAAAGKNAQKLSKHENEADEEILLTAGLSTEGEALLEFFRERMQPKADLAQLLALARQLGDGEAETRAKAAAKLVARGPAAVPALRHVINELENPMAAQQARHCLEWIEGKQSAQVPIAAAKLLAERRPAGAAKTLLEYMPLADDEAVLAAVKAALDRLAVAPGTVDPALVAALNDPLTLRRVTAVDVLAASGRPEVLPAIRKLLTDKKSPQVRLRAALALTQRLDETAVGVLIDLLLELPTAERRQAEQALKHLAGEWSPSPPLVGDDELSRKIRREAWAAWWRTVDGPALLAAFRQRTLSEAETAAAEALIEQLGDKSFSKREKALQSLLTMGPKVIGLLREAARSKDLEQAQRAQKCLKQLLVQDEKERLPSAAPRLLTVRKPAGACEALLGYLPFTDDVVMKQEVGKALKSLAVVDGKADPGVIKALSDPLPVRKLAAADALVAAGGATHPAVRKLLTNADPQVRLRVALALVHAQDRDAMPALIDLLADLPRAQSGEVEELLQRLAGAKAPKIASAKDDAATRKKLRDAWQAWWKQDGPAVDLAQLERATGMPGLTVVAELGPAGKAVNPPAGGFGGAGGVGGAGAGGFGGAGGGGFDPQPGGGKKGGKGVAPANAKAGTDRLVALDRNGQPQWQIENLLHPIDFQLLPGDHVLIAEYKGNRVTERDFKGNIVWQVDLPRPPVSVQRLANGNTFIALYNTPATGGGTMLEVDRAGKTVATFDNPAGAGAVGPGAGVGGKKGAAKTANSIIRAAYKMADGQMICLQSKGICVRMDASGKEIKRFALPSLGGVSAVVAQVPNFAGNIDVTGKGHIIAMLEDNTVAEYDPEGKLVWQAKADGNRPTRLTNGNTLIASQAAGVVELDQAGNTVWEYKPPPGYSALRARPAGDVRVVAPPVPIGAPPPAKAAFGGIDPKVVAAWQKAGAKFEWTELAGFKQLRMLDLKGAGVTDADLKSLGGLKHLQTLYLGNNSVTDAGIKELVGLALLETLGLGNTNVSDAGLKDLAGLKQLQHLTLTGTQVTPAGIAELQKALPNLTVNGGLKAKGK